MLFEKNKSNAKCIETTIASSYQSTVLVGSPRKQEIYVRFVQSKSMKKKLNNRNQISFSCLLALTSGHWSNIYDTNEREWNSSYFGSRTAFTVEKNAYNQNIQNCGGWFLKRVWIQSGWETNFTVCAYMQARKQNE